jgi:hypothetical protein
LVSLSTSSLLNAAFSAREAQAGSTTRLLIYGVVHARRPHGGVAPQVEKRFIF